MIFKREGHGGPAIDIITVSLKLLLTADIELDDRHWEGLRLAFPGFAGVDARLVGSGVARAAVSRRGLLAGHSRKFFG
ncbi:hypothetical protein SDC9_176915 [bioreactor metagenome]|uniref:Uncharacterized protein n=1 Tax=bioreactor metagenome TaxID=1076179 RepID=A0A645GU06_9ZZZZ